MTGPMTERGLLQVWDGGCSRMTWTRVRAAAVAEDDAPHLALAEDVLRDLPEPLVALAANAELVRRLVGARWYMVMLAREGGASWEQVAEALGCTWEEAVAAYIEAITAQEKHAGDLHDAARARAVLTPARAQADR